MSSIERRAGLAWWWGAAWAAWLITACGDSGGSGAAGGAGGGGQGGGTTQTGTGGGASCTAALASSYFSEACLDCAETACCATAAACASDALCPQCVDNSGTEGCSTNAPALDLLNCIVTSECQPLCGCVECFCLDDGNCDAGFMGFETCDCADCLESPVAECQGQCDADGMCESSDACTCSDCAAEPGCEECNLDGFCDTYRESCACADCEAEPVCDTQG